MMYLQVLNIWPPCHLVKLLKQVFLSATAYWAAFPVQTQPKSVGFCCICGFHDHGVSDEEPL